MDDKKLIAGFSKGMKRKVNLLFALCIHPRLILLDEAYDGLESVARLHFKQALADLVEDDQTSVIISSHNLKELEDICDSFGILQNGKISDYGDLINSVSLISKYQLAFKEDLSRKDFEGLDILHFEKEGQIYKLIIRGDKAETQEKLENMHPILLNVLPVNFEELFIYEVESEENHK